MCIRDSIIERSNSNFLNPMVIVKKKINQIRICLDMRNLNSITKKCFDCAPNEMCIRDRSEGSAVDIEEKRTYVIYTQL